MDSHLQALTAYFSAHLQILLVTVFAGAALGALAVIGTVIPGSSILFVGGVLIGLDALNPWWTVIAAGLTRYWATASNRKSGRADPLIVWLSSKVQCMLSGRAYAVAASTALFVGCTSYSPSPIDSEAMDNALTAPDKAMLSARAGKLCHPRMAPITLDFSRPLTADELAVIAVLVNPDLKATRAKLGVAEAQVFEAGLLPDPTLAIGLDHPTSSQPGLVSAFNFGVSWDILGLVTRRAARRGAQARRLQVRDDVAWNEWMVANQTRLIAYRIAYLQVQYDIASGAADTASRLLESSRRNLERRDITIDAFSLREVAYLDARDKALALARTLEKARQDLNRNLGLPPAEVVLLAKPANLDNLPIDSSALFDIARNHRLDLVALRAGYLAQGYRLQRDLLARFPQFNLGLNRARDTGDVSTIGFSVGISLPIFNGGRGAVAIGRATREQLRAEYEARLFQTRSDIATLVADIEFIDHEIEPLNRQLPDLQRAEAVMRGALARGDVTAITYQTVQSNLLALRLKLSSLEQARAEQQVALQLATGAPWNTKESACEPYSS
jgi:cobalt-zinc-cadmium efflux system outer membrane protein